MFPSEPDPDDVESISNDRLQEEIVDLAARIASATCRWLRLIAEFDRRGAHEEWGFQDCASWLAWRCSLAARSAREHVRVARSLVELPLICEAMSAGELSYSKVRVLTRVATPELEADLVELARHATAAQLERIAGSYRRVLNAAEAERVYERRFLSYEWEVDGSLSIHGALAPEDGALLLRALEAGRQRLRSSPDEKAEEDPDRGSAEPRDDAEADLPRTREPVNADALVLMAEALLSGDGSVRPAGERAQIVVHVDDRLLTAPAASGNASDNASENGSAEPPLPARCELEDGAQLSPETARRLACEASRVTIAHGRDGPVELGRRSRTIPAAMRRAIDARDGGCRFPGCQNRRWTDAHHIVHWAHGGETSQENLVLLCRRHHRLVHEGGFGLSRDQAGELRFWRPDGSPIERSPALSRSRGGRRRLRRALRPARGTPVPLSGGERFDLGLTVSLLADRTTTRKPQGP